MYCSRPRFVVVPVCPCSTSCSAVIPTRSNQGAPPSAWHTRRDVLLTSIASTWYGALHHQHTHTHTPPSMLLAPPSTAEPALTALPTSFSADDFVLEVPAGFRVLEDEPDPSTSARPRSTLDGEIQRPIRARFISPDGRSVITVLARDASSVKPTFLQVWQQRCIEYAATQSIHMSSTAQRHFAVWRPARGGQLVAP